MKTCANCNSIEPDLSKFCSNCGSADFKEDNLTEEINSTVLLHIREDGFENTFEDAKKQRTKKMFLMLGVLLLILIAIIFAAIVKMAYDSKNIIHKPNYIENIDVPFAEGVFENGVYHNEWADLTIDLSNGWFKAPQEQYELYEDENTICDFYAKNGNDNSLVVLLLDLSFSKIIYSESDLLEELSLGISSGLDNSLTTGQSYQLIGDWLYVYSDTRGEANGKPICITSYLRIKDDHAILVNITSSSLKYNHEISGIIS